MQIKTILRKTGHAVLEVLSFLFLFVMLVHVLIAVGFVWLGTPGGQAMMRKQINLALEGTGYSIDYHALYYSAVGGLNVTGLRVDDANGVIADADRMTVRLGLLPLAARHAAISVDAGAITVHRIPAGEARAEDDAATGFTIPDLYFRSLSLDRLRVKRLDLREGVAGPAMVLAPDIAVKANLSSGLALDIKATIGQPDAAFIAWMPQTIRIKGVVDTQNLRATLETFLVQAESFTVEGVGQADLHDDGAIDFNLNVDSSDLQPLTGEGGQADLVVRVSGATRDPALDVSGSLIMDRMVENGLPRLDLKVTAQNLASVPAGTAAVSGRYRDMDLQTSFQFSYDAPRLNIADFSMTGPDLKAGGDIVIDTSTLLASGDVRADVAALATYAPLIGVDIAGRINASASLAPTADATQAMTVDADIGNARYETYTVDHLDMKVALDDVRKMWPKTMDIAVKNARLSDTIAIQTMTAKIAQNDAGHYRLSADGTGTMPHALRMKGSASLSALDQSIPSARDIDLNVTMGASSVRLAGDVVDRVANLSVTTKNFNMADLPATLPEALKGVLLTGAVDVTGPLDQPVINVKAQSNEIIVASGVPGISLSATGHYEAGVARVEASGTGTGIQDLSAHASVPASLSLYPFAFNLSEQAALKGAVNADLDSAVLAGLVLPPGHRMAGLLRVDGTITGTPAAPDAHGTIAFQNGTYDNEQYDVALRDIDVVADLDRTKVELKKLSANDGQGGTIAGSGSMDFVNTATTSMNLNLDQVRLVKSNMADGTADASLALKGRADGYDVTGTITLNDFNITIPEKFSTQIPELNIVTPESGAAQDPFLQKIALNVKLDAPHRIFVRGWGLDAEFGGDLDITGTLNAPLVNGAFESIRGRYEEFGKRFELVRANLRFQGAVPPSPYLDVEATHDTGDVKASVLLSGRVSEPKINFASVPALPEDEVMSRILFGKDMSRISAFQAVQLTQTLQRFSGKGGGFDPVGMVREMTGLDDISVESYDDGATTVGVGKYLTDRVYLRVENDTGGTGSAASIEVEVTPSISVESSVGQDAQVGGGVFWTRDY
ncbi:translocation/assembly module TamB domain-containing protein [Micavibrio aeruginosavorus]|uniref:translocation/assembly module TamB domain-containing protein n=1 Tax=Micavibrio aeruginosavorus TaxID=349221 RepID=UPI003F4A9426